MEDSGIDSEDRPSTAFDDNASQTVVVSPATHMAENVDLDLALRGSSAAAASANAAPQVGEDGVVVIRAQPTPMNTCRILQRKLELKVERAKRNYSQYQKDHVRKSQSANLIPISRLSIPGDLEQKPLVDYESESSDEPEDISFFPAKLKGSRRQKGKPELSDTFSIQEMTIDSELESDDSGSQSLELVPPMKKSTTLDKLKSCFCAK